MKGETPLIQTVPTTLTWPEAHFNTLADACCRALFFCQYDSNLWTHCREQMPWSVWNETAAINSEQILSQRTPFFIVDKKRDVTYKPWPTVLHLQIKKLRTIYTSMMEPHPLATRCRRWAHFGSLTQCIIVHTLEWSVRIPSDHSLLSTSSWSSVLGSNPGTLPLFEMSSGCNMTRPR